MTAADKPHRLGTHWDECWRVHHQCAIALIEQMHEVLRRQQELVRKCDEDLRAAVAQRRRELMRGGIAPTDECTP